MRRGELYRMPTPTGRDPKRNRVFVIVSRQALFKTKFPMTVCAPVYSHHNGLETQVRIGIDEGMKHESRIHCDELVSLPRVSLTNYVGTLPPDKIKELNVALKAALELDEEDGI